MRLGLLLNILSVRAFLPVTTKRLVRHRRRHVPFTRGPHLLALEHGVFGVVLRVRGGCVILSEGAGVPSGQGGGGCVDVLGRGDVVGLAVIDWWGGGGGGVAGLGLFGAGLGDGVGELVVAGLLGRLGGAFRIHLWGVDVLYTMRQMKGFIALAFRSYIDKDWVMNFRPLLHCICGICG